MGELIWKGNVKTWIFLKIFDYSTGCWIIVQYSFAKFLLFLMLLTIKNLWHLFPDFYKFIYFLQIYLLIIFFNVKKILDFI